jgi:signal transduction histidine kinase
VLAFYGWLRRHPALVDSALALPLAVLGLTVLAGQDGGWIKLLGLGCVAAMGVAVALRRKRPAGAFTAVLVAGGLQVTLVRGPNVADLSVLVLLYTLAAYRPRRAALPGLLAVLGGSAVATVKWIPASAIHDGAHLSQILALFWGPAVTAWLLGDMMRWRRSYYDALEERAARLERERDAQSQIAAAAERARIARELHDVVAHNVTVMVVQADGAAYALDGSPERAREALGAISATGRQALAEMRSLLGVLRSASGQADDAAALELAPQPGIEQLSELLEQARTTGLPVSFAVEGLPRRLPPGTALTAYRVVQESLTNARKHGGTGVTARVTLRFREDGLDIIVTDDGRPASRGNEPGGDGQGHGLIGMRERVDMFGGTVTAGPRPGGGYRVAVSLPASPLPVLVESSA